ncbi:hypothetical protein VMCG_01864 [Cytospora schulzeri]|uniref:RRM domain-containing protein n=1 Tax=Cytospora schulzeri TaxID=448051 RepID=A0A423X3M5_9PEZI|nr:hypothetical protein VMCG_01864 [Valsa malicola]
MASTVSSTPQGFVAPMRPATVMVELPPRTHWSYVRDRNGMIMTEPVVGFYFNPPAGAKCRWSTDNGRREPQHIPFGLEVPQRVLVLWNDAKLETEAAYYRQKYWEDMKTLTAPQRFEDLYEYFDGATIWIKGAINLWNLLNLLVAEAHTNWQEHERRVATECNDWILDWLENFPAAQFNRDSLIRWNQKTDILTAVITHYDWMNDLKDLDMVGQNIMHGQPDLKIGSPPPQVLATIPENASPVKASAKANGLTIDTIASTKIPRHTASAPATAVPHITVTPQVRAEAEDALVRKDGGDSTNDEFFNPQALATQIEVKARQLSAQSAPEEESESMLNAGRNHSKPRAASTSLQSVVLQKKDVLPRHTVSKERPPLISAIKTNYNINNPPSRPARKSPPRGPISRRHAVANVPTYHVSQHPMAQQGAPMGPTQTHQHMMPPFGPHNGMQPQQQQQQPPAGFIPPTPPHGMPPHPNALAPQGPPPPPGVSMPPMGPPGVPFQGQFTMPQPRMDMPPFNNPQGHPMNAPPQYPAQQNVGVPMYQPNGYIAQSQHQPGAFNGNRQVNQNSRRGSVNSRASRKLRDDPIHGPVYAMNPRKHSNASSGRGSRKPSSAKPEQMVQGPRANCVNLQVFHNPSSAFSQLYDECPCHRCVEASKSVFVKHETQSLSDNQVRDTLMRYFAAWGPTRVKTLPNNRAALVVFHTDHDAVSAIQSFWSGGDKHAIPGLNKSTWIWYPLYSRHYSPMTQQPSGAPRGLVEAQNTSRRLSGSSMQRRGSNPYLGQRPVFNNPNFGNGAPGLQQLQLLREQPQQMAGQPNFNNSQPSAMHAVPYQPQPPQASQRALWVPPASDNRRKSGTTASSKGEKAVSPKTCPEEPLKKEEDWRSKPPSEEAIEDSIEDVAVTDTASNVSSQGARSVTVCLPNENGSVRSRGASPEVEDRPTQRQIKEESPKVKTTPQEEPKKDESPTTVKTETTEDDKSCSGIKEATSDVTVAETVKRLQPVVASEQVKVTKKDNQETASNYSKVASELTGATETIDFNTVVRHKPQKPRNPLPIEWSNEPDGDRSELQSRFTDLQDEFQADIQEESVPAPQIQETEVATNVSQAPEEPAPHEELQAKQPKKSGGKNKNTKKQAQTATDTPTSGPSSNTPTDVQSRVPSRASTSRPGSRASIKRPQSAASTAADLSSRPSSAMQVHREDQAAVAEDGATQPKKKKLNKTQRKRKQALAAESSAASEGLAKTGGSQDQDQNQGRAISGQESPNKKPKTVHPKPEPEPAEKPAVPEPVAEAAADDSQKKEVDEQQAASKEKGKDAGYRANAGGSLRMKKNRSPTKPQQKGDHKENETTPTKQEAKSLQTILEPPNEEDRKYVSPDANLFPNQKFAIDQAKASAPPKMDLGKKENIKPRGKNTVKLTTNNARIGSLPPGFNPYPQLPPNTKPSAWSAVVKRGLNNDPFTSGREDEDQSKNWMNNKAVKSPQKPHDGGEPADTSPTPSPEKKKKSSQRSAKGKSQLNAAAKAFTPQSSPSMSVATLRTAAAATAQTNTASAAPGLEDGKPIPHHHAKKPSLPGRKGSGTDTRLVTPAEQTLDSAILEQPGPPTKEKKRASGPAPDRGGGKQQQQQQQQQKSTSAQIAATAAGNAPALNNQKDFPTLATAVTAPKKRAASFAQTTSGSTAPSTAPSEKKKEDVKPTPSPVAPATSPNDTMLGQRGAVSGPGATPTSAEPAKKAEDEVSQNGDWTTVGPSKKTAGGKNSVSSRIASGRGGKSTQQGGRGGGGRGGGRVPVGEERKGG